MARKKAWSPPWRRPRRSRVARALSLAAAAAPVALPVARQLKGAISSGRDKVEDASDRAQRVVEAGRKLTEPASSTLGSLKNVGSALSALRGGGASGAPKLSHLIEEHTDVALARRAVYDRWVQYEALPSMLKGADTVSVKGKRSSWTSKIGPSRRTWEAEITDERPRERVEFRSKGGLKLRGAVSFHSLDRDLTRVQVQLVYDPTGFVEHVGNLVRIQRRRVRRDLRLFKHRVELDAALPDDHEGDEGDEEPSKGVNGARPHAQSATRKPTKTGGGARR